MSLERTDPQLSTTLPTSTMTLGGLLEHLAYVAHWWFAEVFTGREAVDL